MTWRPRDRFDFAFVASLVVVAAFVAFAVWDTFAWPEYAREHHCERTGRTRDQHHLTCTHSGSFTTCTPYTTTDEEWACDGGERVWR